MRALLIAAAFMITCCSCALASFYEPADVPYSAQVVGTQTTPGSNTWTYMVTNTSFSSDYEVWLLSIEVDPINYVPSDQASEILQYSSVPGWMASFEPEVGKNTINWAVRSRSSDLLTGGSESRFQLTFNQAPQFQNWTVMFIRYDENEDVAETPTVFGDVQAVPEPTGVIALLVGLSALAEAFRKGRSK